MKDKADRSMWWNRPPVRSGTRGMYTVIPMTKKISQEERTEDSGSWIQVFVWSRPYHLSVPSYSWVIYIQVTEHYIHHLHNH